VDAVYYSYSVNGKAHAKKYEDISTNTEFKYDFYDIKINVMKKSRVNKDGESASR